MSKINNPDHPLPKSEDLEQNRDVNALFSSFRVEQAAYRTFSRHRNSKAPEQAERVFAEPRSQTCIQVAIFSPMGGSGKTTLVAGLAGVLWQLGKNVLLVDASPWPTLAFHFGATSARSGLRSFFAPSGKDLPVRILTRELNDPATPNIENYTATAPTDYVLFDLSGISAAELSAYLKQSQVLIVPLVPDLSAVRYAEALRRFLANLENPPQRVMYVVNQMEDTPLAKEALTTLAQALGDLLFQQPIYRQPDVQEALAEGIALPLYAPEAQAVAICNEIARWIDRPRLASSKAQQRWCER